MTASFSTCGSLDSLPEELLVEILAAIPDVHSLWNLALTCRSLYSTVMNQGLRLPRKVFSSRIHERVIDLAFTAVDVRNNQGWLMGWLPNRRRVTRQDIAKGDETKPRHWDFRTILAMDQLHNTVEELTKWICSHVNLPGGQQSLTTNEVCRIQNALYRVEIVCMLYRIQPILYYWQRHLIRNFLARYNIWENEQISSIFEMFREAVGEGTMPISKFLVPAPTDISPRHTSPSKHGPTLDELHGRSPPPLCSLRSARVLYLERTALHATPDFLPE